MQPRSLAIFALGASAWFTTAEATLFIEPVINRVPGFGTSDLSFPLYDPEFINGLTGEHPFLANAPGEIDSVAIGFPHDESLLTFSVWNNTGYDITSLRLSIIGSAFQPGDQDSWRITRDPGVDAFFGDANGDGRVGSSDIFSSIVVSDAGRTITLSGGRIPADSHFTDIAEAFTTDGLTFKAGVDTSFDGVPVPEPATWTLLLAGVGIVSFCRRRRPRHPA